MVDGATAASTRIPKLLFVLSSTGMDLGRSMTPINHDYQAPFVYPGVLHTVTFGVGDKSSFGEIKALARAEMTRQ